MFGFFKSKKEVKAENDAKQFIIAQMQDLKKNNLELKELYNRTLKLEINKKVKSICKVSDKIFGECVKDNSKVSKLNLFINYYQVDVIKILSQYVAIKESKLESEEALEFVDKTEQFMDKVSVGFEKILEDLIISKENSIDADIKVMLDSLASYTFSKE